VCSSVADPQAAGALGSPCKRRHKALRPQLIRDDEPDSILPTFPAFIKPFGHMGAEREAAEQRLPALTGPTVVG
jgi:hypothetical protein